MVGVLRQRAKSLGAKAKVLRLLNKAGRVQHLREPLQLKSPTQPGRPQSAQPPPGALISRASEPATGCSRRAGLEAEMGLQVGGLPRAERRRGVGRRNSPFSALPQKTDRLLLQGTMHRLTPLSGSSRASSPNVIDTQTPSLKKQSQRIPPSLRSDIESPHPRITVLSTRINPQNSLLHPRQNQQNLPRKRDNRTLPTYTQTHL